MSKLSIYAKSVLVPVVVGLIVGIITSSFIDYETLEKPLLSPPSFVFPIVWTILYILMGVSYGILKSNSQIDSEVNFAYYGQLLINALWSIFFFVFKLRLFSFVWILQLLVAVVNMIIKFYSKNKVAGLLQLPYLIWVLFASYLNLSTYLLNR